MRDHLEHYRTRLKVKADINSCNRCPLGDSPHRVPFDGNTWTPKLVLLGEAPGASEAIAHRPFVGASGVYLDHMLAMAGTSREDVTIVNTVCCRPPDNRDPEWSEMAACGSHRLAQVNLARTSFGLTLGRIPLALLTDIPGVSVGKEIDHGFWADEKFWIPTYHPAYALRNRGAESVIVNSIRRALQYVSGELETPVDPKFPNYKVVDGMLIKKHDTSLVPQKYLETWPVFLHREWVVFRHDPEMVRAAKDLRGQKLA